VGGMVAGTMDEQVSSIIPPIRPEGLFFVGSFFWLKFFVTSIFRVGGKHDPSWVSWLCPG